MANTYDFSFGEDTVYAAVRDLVAGLGRTGTVLDLGCGYGALAEAVTALGLTYVGADLDPDGLKALEERGFRTAQLDLEDLGSLERLVHEQAADGPLAAVLLLDTLEHLARPDRVLEALNRTAPQVGSPALVVSIPNVTHTDLAAKLLLGRWDVTPTGLLDRTHLQLFSAERLDAVMRAAGWFETARKDFALTHSDQHFPAGLPTLDARSPLGHLLREVRERAEPSAWVNQFVRAYVSGTPASAPAAPEAERPFLSILVRTRGTRPETLRDLMLCLAAQTDDDFEVLLLVHGATQQDLSEVGVLLAQQPEEARRRTTLVQVPPGGGRSRPLNVGVARARGRYVSVVDDDDVVLGSYVAEFAALARTADGRVLRTVVVEQDVVEAAWPSGRGHAVASPFRYAFPPTYDVLMHLVENYTPFCGFALPVTFFTDLGHCFDESLPVLEDWDVQLRAVQLCGVASSPVATSIYRRWRAGTGDNSNALHTDEHWRAARGTVIAKGDALPLLLPPGSRGALYRRLAGHTELEQLRAELEAVTAARDDLRAEREDLLRSTSWRVTWPLRRASDLLARRGRR